MLLVLVLVLSPLPKGVDDKEEEEGEREREEERMSDVSIIIESLESVVDQSLGLDRLKLPKTVSLVVTFISADFTVRSFDVTYHEATAQYFPPPSAL